MKRKREKEGDRESVSEGKCDGAHIYIYSDGTEHTDTPKLKVWFAFVVVLCFVLLWPLCIQIHPSATCWHIDRFFLLSFSSLLLFAFVRLRFIKLYLYVKKYNGSHTEWVTLNFIAWYERFVFHLFFHGISFRKWFYQHLLSLSLALSMCVCDILY